MKIGDPEYVDEQMEPNVELNRLTNDIVGAAIEALGPVQTAQVISYLRATKLPLAILINFNVKRLIDGIKQIAL
jgi:GxxExxY protein